ncbi:Eco57I restriction-modification methylase domain-containing protein [Pseudomonas chlororaphis]|uniref:Eco57I restriction-modification methylase domain-containing protein n=1 Tax=Pseudomonas chlororaphis TaxID=587753 RepID=UPI0024078205|nr:DNA methyltransferase [Pseudomonas chlororaphis]
MSVSRHHADWLNLVEHSGPFFSLPVVSRVFSNGLDPRDTAQAKRLREAYELWQDNPAAPGKQHAWVMHVLTEVLDYPKKLIAESQAIPAGLEARMAEMGEILRPDIALLTPIGREGAGQAQMLISFYPPEQQLDKPVVGKHWKATPATRMMELLHGAGIPLGLATNGEQWMLVYAPRGETTGYASWYASLWMDEPITLRAFHSLLGTHRFFGVSDANTPLGMLKESANDQQEVTDQLGYQVREAVEVLVQSFDALDKESGRKLLHGVSESTLYDAALTVMMRLVFLFSAEERGMLQLGKSLYDDNYAVSTLQELLQEVADRYGEEVLERRTDAWARLLASFRSVHGGVHHQDLSMPAYGGSLFDPDRFPFLEGRAGGTSWKSAVAEPLAINNRVVLHLLNSLQRLRVKGTVAGGLAETRRVSFRALGVEQIGHVYEGLLDHTAITASEPVLGLKGSSKKEPEVALMTLESLLAQGEEKLIAFLKEETGRSPAALKKLLTGSALMDEHKLLIACGQDQDLLARIQPFAGLIREDSFERPLVILSGGIYVTNGSTRRSTGTHYTPPSLTEPVVRHTLEPLVYQGPTEGWLREQWKLKSPREILELKVCDLAMGSGAFLVQACRYLAERLVEAWENEEQQHPDETLITPEGEFSKGSPCERLVPSIAEERVAIARRVIADRCLYGVDLNPMAVEMAKLSLWLITMDPKRPFSFLDHAFKHGDSLVGITALKQLENFSVRPDGGLQKTFATLNIWRYIDDAKKKRIALEAMPSDTPEQIAAKAELYSQAEKAVVKLNAVADLLLAVELEGFKGTAFEEARDRSADYMMGYWGRDTSELQEYAASRLMGRKFHHWSLTFPEVFERGGFDALIGNPPFQYGTLLSTNMGEGYVSLLSRIFDGWHGKADLVGAFFRRAATLINANGVFGFIATSSIIRGETADAALKPLGLNGLSIFAAKSPFPWPGKAAGDVVMICYSAQEIKNKCLNNEKVKRISAKLDEDGRDDFSPLELASNGAFGGGLGVKLSPANREVPAGVLPNYLAVYPELQGVLVKAVGGRELYGNMIERDYPCVVNSDCKAFKTILEKYPLDEFIQALQHSRPAQMVREVVSRSRFTFACGETCTHLIFDVVDKDVLVKHKAVVFGANTYSLLACIQSSVHSVWAWELGLRRVSGLVYSPKRCFHTFPLPANIEDLPHLSSLAEDFVNLRREISANYGGLTGLYNAINDSSNANEKISALRQLIEKIDIAVLDSYQWTDISLDHDFYRDPYSSETNNVRFTISESSRREILDRLLELNHHLYAKEVLAGLHEKKSVKAAGTVKRTGKPTLAASPQVDMFS